MAWHCFHCGTEIYGGANRCPNCDRNPFEFEKGELLDVNPKDFRKFIATGKLSMSKRKKIFWDEKR